MSDTVEAFLRHVEADTQQHNVELRFVPSLIVGLPDDPSYECAGYFTEHPQLILCVATGKPRSEWLPVLAHEYSHFRQWADGAEVWQANLYNGVDGEGLIDNWIHHRIELHPDRIQEYITSTLSVELDAEKRAVEYVKGFALPIDETTYIQRANASLMYYGCIPRNRKWFDYNPFEITDLCKAMPPGFLAHDDYLNLPQYYVDLYNRHCFKSCTSGSI